jgi:small subunit ribosomal protein S4
MARETNAKCRKCRRAGEKLFLKGDRCATPKCAVIKRAYAPGVHGKKMKRGLSEYGLQLSAKQKIKRIYGVLEKQFRRHFEEVQNKKGVTGDLLLERLEMRLDNVIYRMGLGSSRSQARQLVNHGWITINGKKTDIPSAEVKVGMKIALNASKIGKKYLIEISQVLKNKKDVPSWIDFNPDNFEGKIVRRPERAEAGINIDAQIVVEYYSR